MELRPIGRVVGAAVEVDREFGAGLLGLRPGNILLFWFDERREENPIRVSIVRLTKIEENRLSAERIEVPEGALVVDIKPFFEELDAYGKHA